MAYQSPTIWQVDSRLASQWVNSAISKNCCHKYDGDFLHAVIFNTARPSIVAGVGKSGILCGGGGVDDKSPKPLIRQDKDRDKN